MKYVDEYVNNNKKHIYGRIDNLLLFFNYICVVHKNNTFLPELSLRPRTINQLTTLS